LIVRAALGDVARVEDENLIGIADRRRGATR
jgi:hypothetical protein